MVLPTNSSQQIAWSGLHMQQVVKPVAPDQHVGGLAAQGAKWLHMVLSYLQYWRSRPKLPTGCCTM